MIQLKYDFARKRFEFKSYKNVSSYKHLCLNTHVSALFGTVLEGDHPGQDCAHSGYPLHSAHNNRAVLHTKSLKKKHSNASGHQRGGLQGDLVYIVSSVYFQKLVLTHGTLHLWYDFKAICESQYVIKKIRSQKLCEQLRNKNCFSKCWWTQCEWER